MGTRRDIQGYPCRDTPWVATLSGSVPHYAEKWAAERATQRVEGVKAIAEEIEVIPTSHTRKDEDVAQAVLKSLE